MRTLLVAIVVLISSTGMAQTFQLGIKGGANISNFIENKSQAGSSYSALVGWNAGVFTNFMLGKHFSISPEVLYTTAGSKIQGTQNGNGGDVTVSQNLRLSYLSVPVMAKYRFTGGFYLETGPSINFNVSNSSWQNQSVKSITNSAELAWGAGLGYQSPIGLGIGARYNVGITDVNSANNASFNDVNFRNSGFMIDLSWAIFNNRR